MQRFSSNQSPNRERFLSHLRQQQLMLQHECSGFFPGSSMMPMGGGSVSMGMMMMPMAMVPHPYLQQQQWQRLSAFPQQHAPNASGPIGFYSEATAQSRKMILESASAMGMGMDTDTDTGYDDVVKPSISKEMERPSRRMNLAETSRCVSPSSSNCTNDTTDDSDSDCDSDAGSESSSTSTCHAPAKKALMMKAQNETKKGGDEPKRKAGKKRASSEISSSVEFKSSSSDDATKESATVEVETSNSSSDETNESAAAEVEESSSTADFIPEIDQPKRRRSAYNLFFQHERARLLILAEKGEDLENHPPRNLTVEEVRELLENNPYFTDRSKRRHRKSHGKVSFMGLVKTVSNSWKNVDKETKSAFEALAKEDQIRYRREWKEYKLKCRKAKREALQQQKKAAQEEKSAKRAKKSHVASKEERKVETREKVLKKALSMADSSDCSRAVAKKADCDSSMSMPQHDEIMHMISSKIAEHETHSHDDGQLVDLALELDSEFAMGLDGIAMV